MHKNSAKSGFCSMFNGKDLTGWVGDPNLWKVEDGVLVGRTTEDLNYNDFLLTRKLVLLTIKRTLRRLNREKNYP